MDTRSRSASYANVARYTTSSNSGIAPRRRIGDRYVRHVAPSVLVARYSALVVHEPATLPLNMAQYSPRAGIHCTSRCHGNTPGCESEILDGDDPDISS